ncbi:MAG: ABC transporter substrate-binding protein [Rhodobacteraceae bacterium]|nr:ABC transporter substrate-binding protein [Paracoccaceae bacterium]
MTQDLKLGFVALTDAAPLIVAKELGFAEEEGLNLTLVRERSWSSIRDKLAYGVFDAAHMLAPMAIAMSLGLGPVPGKVDVPFVLNLNGNAFVANADLAEKLTAQGAVFGDPQSLATALRAVSMAAPIRVAVPFLTSMHVAMLRFLVTRSGERASDIFDFVVSPPSLIETVLNSGEVDAFMVGAPWGNHAVENGAGQLMLTSNLIWQGAPEKVLALRNDWLELNLDATGQLIRALYRAAEWASRPENFTTLSEILSRTRYLDVHADIIEQMVKGQVTLDSTGKLSAQKLGLRFGGGEVSFPWKSAAVWIAEHEAPHWGVPRPVAHQAARDAFRTDIYRQALGLLDIALPSGSEKLEGSLSVPTSVPASKDLILGPDAFFDGSIFDPAEKIGTKNTTTRLTF